MIVNSFDFLWIFPILFLAYIAILRFRKTHAMRDVNIFLLLASFSIYWFYNKTLTVALLAIIVVTWAGALAVKKRYRHSVAIVSVILSLMPLVAFKYYNFINDNLNHLFSLGGINFQLPGLNLAIPIGISFFTLQAIGYFIDVVKKKIPAEHNLADYMLFVAFFPQIVAGPISKAGDLLPQIKQERPFDATQATQGLKWLLWGMFMKAVVADNIGEVISLPLAKSLVFTSPTVLMAVVLYSIQIYCDFAGYSYMAIGIGKLLGFELINNFERPYFARSVTEFWHRWHRSLSIWLKDYIYIPLGGSRCSKWRTYFNILSTFLVSGLWHGASWTFLLWGGMHGAVQIGEKHTGLNKLPSKRWLNGIMMIYTFVIVTCAWVFFTHPDVGSALNTFKAIFTSNGRHTVDFTLPIILVTIVLIKDLADEYDWERLQFMKSRHTLVRWTTYTVLMASIMVLAVYGEEFIYSGF